MVAFKQNSTYYVAYKANEVGNPHVKKYPCLLDTATGAIATNQRKVLTNFFAENKLDYHEVIHYAEKDINTHDLVLAVIKFHDMKRI